MVRSQATPSGKAPQLPKGAHIHSRTVRPAALKGAAQSLAADRVRARRTCRRRPIPSAADMRLRAAGPASIETGRRPAFPGALWGAQRARPRSPATRPAPLQAYNRERVPQHAQTALYAGSRNDAACTWGGGFTVTGGNGLAAVSLPPAAKKSAVRRAAVPASRLPADAGPLPLFHSAAIRAARLHAGHQPVRGVDMHPGQRPPSAFRRPAGGNFAVPGHRPRVQTRPTGGVSVSRAPAPPEPAPTACGSAVHLRRRHSSHTAHRTKPPTPRNVRGSAALTCAGMSQATAFHLPRLEPHEKSAAYGR